MAELPAVLPVQGQAQKRHKASQRDQQQREVMALALPVSRAARLPHLAVHL